MRSAVLIGLGLILLLGAGCLMLGVLGSGDEAPIRVRNGTVEFELTGGKWEPASEDDDDKTPNWRANTGGGSDTITVLLAVKGKTCDSGYRQSGQKVVVTSTKGTYTLRPGRNGFVFKSWRIRVRPAKDLNLDFSGTRVTNVHADDYVTKLEVYPKIGTPDPTWSCEFDRQPKAVVACVWSGSKSYTSCDPLTPER